MQFLPITAEDFRNIPESNQTAWKQYNRIITQLVNKYSEGETNPVVYTQLVNTEGSPVKSIQPVIDLLIQQGFSVKIKSEQTHIMHSLKVRTAANIVVALNEEALGHIKDAQ
jgi:hypothetical protein